MCIPVNFAKFFRITYSEKHLQTFFARKQPGFKKSTNLCNTHPKKKKNVYVLNRGVVRTQSNIEDEAFCKNRRSIQPLTIFVKNFLLRVLTRFWIRLSFWLENIEKLDEFCCVCKETILNFFFWFHKESPTVCFYHVTYAFRVNLLLPECKGSSCSK